MSLFNAPRASQNRFSNNAGSSLNGFASFMSDNPLTSASVYDNLNDPWSAGGSPAATPSPASAAGPLASVIAPDAPVPSIYHQALAAADPTGSGDVSLNALHRVLSTSHLPAATIERIVNLVSSRPRVSKLEFFVALALVGLAQQGKDVSIEQVAALAAQSALPSPTLQLGSAAAPMSPTSLPAPAYSETDPWSVSSRQPDATPASPTGTAGVALGGGSTVSGPGLPREWWKKQENVVVTLVPEKQGFMLNRYMVYQIQSDRGAAVTRRYSEFAFLYDCLLRRYPFRIITALPPKRIGPDEAFLEQRRKGLTRFINFVANHPILKEDGLVSVFLTEPSFDAWRKHSSISLDEESYSKRVDAVEEMSIPSDLEEKLGIVRIKIPGLIEQWNRICTTAERLVKRREGAAADLSRLTMTLNTLTEINQECWRSPNDHDGCDLCVGVRNGLSQVSASFQTQADAVELRARTIMLTTLESLKMERDLYVAVRDLFIRHDRLSVDQVEKLRKRVEASSKKLEQVKAVQKDGWEAEADKILGNIEHDQATISAQLARRVFIRHCMWHELRVVLHNRENALVSVAVQTFAREERDFAQQLRSNWALLSDNVESMPFE
ncbi:hypothetical protein CALCODRAFT_481801 [Calocera cornea HHB12733]|uniref:Sorting nexin MVP1 n=1 Tax=Calocera cornea HHB12733 TaxID=1353952 RepID=A0A165H9W3_9BASI|nr:hypothetical protein CALCODRAFT_481801 [Calocera cornea HHB12733]